MVFYIWIFFFVSISIVVLLPFWNKSHLAVSQLAMVGTTAIASNIICVGIFGVGNVTNAFSVKALIIYFLGNYLLATILKNKVIKGALFIDKQKIAKWVSFLIPAVCFCLMELIFNDKTFLSMKLQYRVINIIILYV